VFGLLMTVVMYLYETPLASGFNSYLGPVLAMTLHAGFNALSVLWHVEIVVPGSGPIVLPPMAAASVVTRSGRASTFHSRLVSSARR